MRALLLPPRVLRSTSHLAEGEEGRVREGEGEEGEEERSSS